VKAALTVAGDLLREAASRRWFLALGIGITTALVVLGFALRLEVVDGALAATRLFGRDVHSDIRSVDVALRFVYRAAAYVLFYGGLAFGIVACADFGPSLLAPGRIEHLLSLPVRRYELLLGTFLGVLALSLIGAAYGAGGFTLIFAIKTGVWTARPIAAAMLASVTFAGIYGAMLSAAVALRSAALSAAVGVVLFALGIVAGYRDRLDTFFEAGAAREAFRAVTFVLPRVSALADASADIAASAAIKADVLASQMAGLLIFGFSALALGIHLFEQKDF
jgi:Cu-processing system permease protein